MNKQDDVSDKILEVFYQAIEIIPNSVLFLNSDGHILNYNQKIVRELGYQKDNFGPKTIFEVNPDTSLLSWKRLWKKLIAEKQFSIETEQMTIDDTIYPVRMNGILLEINDQKFCLAIIEDLMRKNRFEDLLSLTSEIAKIGSWEWDLIRDQFVLSKEMYNQLHIAADDTIDKTALKKIIKDSLSVENHRKFKQGIKQSIKTGKPFEMEFALRVQGTYENFNFQAYPVWHEDQSIKIYGTLQNLAKISKRTDDLYFTRFCLDYARDMIFWSTPTGAITYANQATADKLGYTIEELLQKNLIDISPDKDLDITLHWDELKEEKSLEFETIHVTKDGTHLPVSVVANYIKYKDKEFNCGFVRDLSNKKKRQELITIAKHSLDQSNDLIFWLTSDGKFKYFNEAFLTLTGYSPKEIDKMKVFDFFPESNLETFETGWKNLADGAIIHALDRTLKTKSGEIIPTEMSINMVKIDGEAYTSTVLRDVRERKKKELQITTQLDEIAKLQVATEAENVQLKEEIDLEFNFNNIISRDPKYKKVLRQVEQVADTNATVLILGETGTGKELLARAVHQLSDRADTPMVKVNCGALPQNLIESELFGHEKGSFTGAYQQKIGKFERAHQSTIFLDEMGELPLDLQSQLLRVLQEGEIERVGGNKTIKIDVRIIAATNRDLEKEVEEGRFREDLFYRLNVFPIHNIPLRERREDIPVLVKHFVKKYSKRINKPVSEISQSSLNKLMTYDFLGNVRELENLVERAMILSKGKVLTFEHNLFTKKSSGSKSNKFSTMEEMQKSHIIAALKRTNGKVSGGDGAAALLDMNDKTLTSRMRKLSITKLDYLK